MIPLLTDNSPPVGTLPLLGQLRSKRSDYHVVPDRSTAKVKKPGGAIRRRDSIGISSVASLRLAWISGSLAVPPTSSLLANASGPGSQLLGSAGRRPRPATVELLNCKPDRLDAVMDLAKTEGQSATIRNQIQMGKKRFPPEVVGIAGAGDPD